MRLKCSDCLSSVLEFHIRPHLFIIIYCNLLCLGLRIDNKLKWETRRSKELVCSGSAFWKFPLRTYSRTLIALRFNRHPIYPVILIKTRFLVWRLTETDGWKKLYCTTVTLITICVLTKYYTEPYSLQLFIILKSKFQQNKHSYDKNLLSSNGPHFSLW